MTPIVLLSMALAAPPVTAVVVAPEGTVVLAGTQDGIEVRSISGLKKTGTLATEIPNIHDISYSPDGKVFAVAGGMPGKRGLVEFYSWPEAKRLGSVAPHRDSVYKVAWTADSKAVYTAGGDAAVCLVDVATAKTLRTFEGHSKGVLAVVLLPEEGRVVSAGLDETVRVWDAQSGEALRSLSNHTKPVTDIAVRPGGKTMQARMLISVGEDRTVRLWQPTVGRLVRFARLDVVPTAVAWSKDGTQIFAACKDGKVRVLDPDTMAVSATREAIDGVAYCLTVAADGSVIVGGQGGQLVRVK